jgi:hypothetical protein
MIKYIKTQQEFNKLPNSFNKYTEIRIIGNLDYVDKTPENSLIYVYDSAVIESVYDSAVIKSVYGSAVIKSVSDSAVIESVSDSAVIKSVYDSAVIESVSGSAVIKYVYGSAVILLMTGLASAVFIYSAKKIVARGFNLIRQIGTKKINFVLGKNVTFVQVKKTINDTPTFRMFASTYPVETKKGKVILYKAVHKNKKVYFSEHNNSFIYKIGETISEKCDSKEMGSCASGIHIAHKMWAVLFGKDWKDMALLECEVNIKDIVVSSDCDGKVRARKVKVLREVPKKEWYDNI